MNQLKLFIELTRLKKPIGFMLLFWPCIWGLTIVYDFNSDSFKYFFYITLFLGGSILMRSAGCIVNDIVDKNFDKKVERTKDRPIASGKVSIKLGLFYTLVLCSLAFLGRLQCPTTRCGFQQTHGRFSFVTAPHKKNKKNDQHFVPKNVKKQPKSS